MPACAPSCVDCHDKHTHISTAQHSLGCPKSRRHEAPALYESIQDAVTDPCLGCRGTWSWAAPETITGLKCTEKVDIWSYGIVLWELVTLEQPERGRNRPVRCVPSCLSA